MIRRLVCALVAAFAATTLIAAQPAAAAAPAVSVELSDGSQSRHIRLKLYIGRCKDTCRAKVRVTNISRSNLFNARLTLSVKVNGKKMGSCTDYIGRINAKRVRWAACTIRTAKLDNYWDRWLDGDLSRWSPYVYAVTNYRYYV